MFAHILRPSSLRSDSFPRLSSRRRSPAFRRHGSPSRAGGPTPTARPTVELLEGRLLLDAQFVDVGPLRFFGDFTRADTQFTASGGQVSVGLKPAAAEAYLPLLGLDLAADAQVPGVLQVNIADTTAFQFKGAAVQSVVGPKTLPLWQTAAGDSTFTTWSPAQLTSSTGQAVSGGQPFKALGITVTLSSLALLNPQGGDTGDAQVGMRGSATFPQLAGLDLFRLQASITSPNYLVADTAGLHLTGLTATLVGPASFDLFGMTATLINPTVTYANDHGKDTFQFSIGATLQTKTQDNSQQRALDGLDASLAMTLIDDKIDELGFSIEGGFRLFGLGVATDAGNPLTFRYNFGGHQFEISGGLTVTVPTATASTVDVRLGYASDPLQPGILIQDGVVTRVQAYLTGNLQLASLRLSSPIGLTFTYDRQDEQFEMIDAFDDCFSDPEQCLDDNGLYLYYSSYQPPIDPNSGQIVVTSATFTVTYPYAAGTQYFSVTLPDGTVVQQNYYTDDTLKVVQQYVTDTMYVVHVASVDPDAPLPSGAYTVSLSSSVQYDNSDVVFTSVFHQPVPTIAAPVLGPIPTDGTSLVNVTLSGTVDEALKGQASVSLYQQQGSDPAHAEAVATNLPLTTDGAGNWTLTPTWDLSGLTPRDVYSLYAIINDGLNAPVTSNPSASVQVVPPLSGRVLDVAPRHGSPPLPGLLAYLDLNHDGQYDPSEPSSVTNADGYYTFWKVTSHTRYDVGLVVPNGFLLAGALADNTNPRQGVVYDGSHPVTADFGLDKLPSIGGTVFTDLGQDGRHDPGDPGLGNWLVFLDADGNGQHDTGEVATATAADGSYEFLGLTGGPYTVRVLPPPEYYPTSPAPVPYYTVLVAPTLENPYPQVVGRDFGALPFVTVSGNVAQYTLQGGVLSPTTTPVAGATVYLVAAQSPVRINAGGAAVDGYAADKDFSGGQTAQVTGTINTSLVVAPAPQEVYQTSRYGRAFTYTLTGLVPGGSYTVTLHFAETYWTAPGKRVFNVALNGLRELPNLDILAAAGRPYTAISRSFPALADGQGKVTLEFSSQGPGGADNAQVNGIEISPRQTGTVAVNAGGGAYGDYQGDRGSSGGSVFYNAGAIDTSLVAGPAPQYVYQTFRYGSSFTYFFSGFTPGQTVLVRLHFVEHFYTQAGQRLMDVEANSQTELTGFDIFGAARARNRVVAESFLATADSAGNLVLSFWGRNNEALVNAIEVGAVAATATTDADGDYSFPGVRAGAYEVVQAVPSGSRQVAPFAPGLVLQPPAPGTRPPSVLAPYGPFPQLGGVVAADLDGAGARDLVVLYSSTIGEDYRVQIYFDAGQGNAPTYNPFVTQPVQVLTGDFYGTGRQDIVVLDRSGQIGYLQNQGGLEFWTTSGWAVYPDFGKVYGMARGQFAYVGGLATGRDQLAVLYELADNQGPVGLFMDVLYVDASGTLQRATSVVPMLPDFQPGRMVAGNLTGDSQDDLLIGFYGQSPLLGHAVGGGSYQFKSLDFLPPGETVVAGDIDGDGYDDPGVFDGRGLFHYAVGDAAGNYQTYSSGVGVTLGSVGGVLLRDMNGDFRPDLVWVSLDVGYLTALRVALNTGQEGAWLTLAGQTLWPLALGAVAGLILDVADLNGDSLNDAVVADMAGSFSKPGGFVEIAYNNSVIAPTPYFLTARASDLAGNNFVNVQLGQVNGRVYDDVSRDGASLPAKPGRTGVQVYVDLNRNGRLDPGEPTSVTGPDGWFAFAGLPAGAYAVRWQDEPGRRPTSAEGGVFAADLSDPGRLLTRLDFGNAVLRDHTLTMPADGSRAWSVLRNRGRLEVFDSVTGVVFSEPVDEVWSLALATPAAGSASVTLDLARGGFVRPGGGLWVRGSGPADSLRLALGGGDNQATVGAGSAMLDAGLRVGWTGVESLAVDSGPGRDRLTVTPQAAAIRIGAGSPVEWPGDRLTVLGEGHGASLAALGPGAGVWTFADAAPVAFAGVEDLTRGDLVWELYRDVLGRAPDEAGHAWWRAVLAGGAGREQLFWSLWTSPEHRGLQVDALYRRYLHREADPAGRAAWVAAMLGVMTEAEVALALVTSDEYRLRHGDVTAFLEGLYRDALGRAPDAAGLVYWQEPPRASWSRAAVAAVFLASPEALGRVIDGFYQEYLGRAADAAGRAHWLDGLVSGRLTPDRVAAALASSDEFFARTV